MQGVLALLAIGLCLSDVFACAASDTFDMACFGLGWLGIRRITISNTEDNCDAAEESCNMQMDSFVGDESIDSWGSCGRFTGWIGSDQIRPVRSAGRRRRRLPSF